MSRIRHLAGLVCLVVSLGYGPASRAEMSLDELETRLDFTIRSACHGYMIDAIPDFLADARQWLNRETPFCQTVRTLPDSESSVELLRREQTRLGGEVLANGVAGARAKASGAYTSRMREYYARQQGTDIECQDWMCQHVRMRVWEAGNPISQADYEKVAAYCGGGYGCIESWFASWPRDLPAQTAVLSLDDLLDAQARTGQAARTGAADPGLGLDALLGNEPQAPVESTALDTLAATNPEPAGANLSLDNIFAQREQLALGQSQRRIDAMNKQLSSLCECSLRNAGCFELPSQTLLDQANQQERLRYDQCTRWDQQKAVAATSAQQADDRIRSLAETRRQVQAIDQMVAATIERWEEQQRRLLAQRRQAQEQRNNTALLTGMLSILAQGGSVADGNLSAEQAAQNAFEVTQSIQNGGQPGSQVTHRNVTSSVPGFSGGNSAETGDSGSGNNNFSCYSPSHRICIDYSVPGMQKAAQMKNQCRQGGNRLVDGCDRQGASCTISNAAGSQTTFSYDSSAARVESACLANGGSYRNY